MTTQGRDPFEDLLDLGDDSPPPLPDTLPPAGDGDGPPPLPKTQPPGPGTDSWMVLSSGEEDFKSVTDNDLFGLGITAEKSNKVHGTTFDDLFREGTSDKKTKKSSTSHGSTFEDLFDDEPLKDSKTTYDDLFPEEGNRGSKQTSKTAEVVEEELFGSGISKKPIKVGTKTLDDLFSTSDGTSKAGERDNDLEDIFGTSSGKPKTSGEMGKLTDSDEDLFSSGRSSRSNARTKTGASREESVRGVVTSSAADKTTKEKKDVNLLDDHFGSKRSTDGASKEPLALITSDSKGKRESDQLGDMVGGDTSNMSSSYSRRSARAKESDRDQASTDVISSRESKKKADTFDELFGKTESNSSLKKSSGPTYEDLFGDDVPVKNTDADIDALFGSTKSKISKHLDDKLSDKGLDKFVSVSSKSETNDTTSDTSADVLLGTKPQADKATLGGTKNDNSDPDDLFDSKPPTTDSATNGHDTVASKVDIMVTSTGETAKPHTSSGDYGEEDLDFSVIEDTSLLDANISRHKTSLRKRGSLALRKRPTRGSMRRVHQQEENTLSLSPDKDDDKTAEDVKNEAPSVGESLKGEVEPEPPRQVKKSPVAGGKLLFGPDVISQSKLMQGLASRRAKTEDPRSNGAAEVDKENKTGSTQPSKPETTLRTGVSKQTEPNKSQPSTKSSSLADSPHRPVIKSNYPQIAPRSRVSAQVEPRPKLEPKSGKGSQDETKQNDTGGVVLRAKLTQTQPSPSKVTPVTLEKVTLRSTHSGSNPPEPKASSEDSNGVNSELLDRRSSLRRVSPAKVKEESKEEQKSSPSWLSEMRRRGSRSISEVAKVTESKPVVSGQGDASDTRSAAKPTIPSRRRVGDSPRASENKPVLPSKPIVDKPKPKIEAIKPLSSVNGKGDHSSRPPLGIKETNTSSTDVPSWKRELAERNKKRKDDPVQPQVTPPRATEQTEDVASNWRFQLSQKRKSQSHVGGDVKSSSESKTPEWTMQAEQRRARLIKLGVIAKK